ncbi:MAG: hypothetical protein LBD13_08410 [Spirochaetaceae bacterium]|jgi:hypothetical protein|nr:hypothetical protein [Spirochaetaceae bacterium]
MSRETGSADNSLYINDLSGDRTFYFVVKKGFFVVKISFFVYKISFFVYNKTPNRAAGGRARRRKPFKTPAGGNPF